MPSGLFYFNSLDRHICFIRGVWLLLLLLLYSCFVGFSELNANSVDSYQTPHSAASDLGLHCVPMSLLWDARFKWNKHHPVLNWTLNYNWLSPFTDTPWNWAKPVWLTILCALLDKRTTNRVLRFLAILLFPSFFIIVYIWSSKC